MKRIMMLILTVIFLATASANAGTYTVVKGDNMSRIAKNHGINLRAMIKANPGAKNPNLIYPNQELTIPTTVQTPTSAVETEFTPLNSLGLYPFGSKRNGIKAIGMFSLPEEVKQALIAKVQNGEFELSWDTGIKKGDRFSEMVFGDYKIVKNKIANWDSTWLEASRLYKVEFKGVVYLLYEPLKCHNWAWWSAEKKPAEEAITPPAKEPPAKIEPPVVEATPPAEAPPVVEPPVVEATPPAEAPPVVEPPVVESKPPVVVEVPPAAEPVTPVVDECSISYESYGWAGHYWALEGGGQSNYYGGKANFFFCPHETSWGKMREGAGFTINGWDGDNSGYEFRGNRWTIGPVVDLVTKDGSRFTTSLQLGQQRDTGYDGAGYEAGQRTNILYLGQTADFYYADKFVFKTENWLDVTVDIGHDKESSWQSWPISEANDPAENKSNVSVGSRVYFWQTENFHGGLVGKGNYAFGDHVIGLEAGPFIADKEDVVKLGAGFGYQFNSAYENNNGSKVGIGMDLDIVKTIDKVVRYLKTTNKEEK